MTASTANWRSPTVVLVCGGLILTLAMGIRHGFGLFLQPISSELGWGRETFALAIAVQNLVWGVTQPFAGMIADRFGSVLPTARMVDAIYEQSAHHLKPSPLPAGPLMTSNLYLLRHQQRIDEQRSGLLLGELISGHKKDLVLSNRLRQLPGRVAIYGWHRAPGHPIQPLSTVHGARYVDYSHGVRLVSATVVVGGRPRSIYDALQDSRVAPILSREGVTRDAWALMHPRVFGPRPAPAAPVLVARPE